MHFDVGGPNMKQAVFFWSCVRRSPWREASSGPSRSLSLPSLHRGQGPDTRWGGPTLVPRIGR